MLPRRISDQMQYSRTGGATIRRPTGNFSSTGLARLFGADPEDAPRTSPHVAHSETSIIIGAVCGVGGLALVVALGWYAASWWRTTRIHPRDHPPHEFVERGIGGNVPGGTVAPVELPQQSEIELPPQSLVELPPEFLIELPPPSPSKQSIRELGTRQTNIREDHTGF